MDNAVALVQSYLQVNGYFTVAEYPIIASGPHGGYRAVTDLDILAFRFPRATRVVPRLHAHTDTDNDEREDPDPVLGVPVDQADMLIGEVKEGRAEMNEAATNPAVLQAALARFGCCPSMDTQRLTETLLRKGATALPSGHRLRMVAFGVSRDDAYRVYTRIPMGHVVTFLQDYLRRHWEVLRHAQLKDPAFGFLATLEKALQKPARV